MQQHVAQVMPPRVQSVHLTVQHVGKRCERMPVTAMNMSERPENRFMAETAGDVRIVIHIFVVIVLDEAKREGLAKNGPYSQRQRNADRG